MSIVWMLIGCFVGGVIAWFAARVKTGSQIAVLQERSRLGEETASKLAQREAELARLQSELAAQKIAAEKDRDSMAEKIGLLEKAEEHLGKQFENLANRIFEDRSNKFAGDSRNKLDELLRPFKEQLTDFRKRVDDIYSQEGQQRASLLQEIKTLKELNNQISQDATDLTNALKGESKTRGNWGELIVERVLELSGLTEGREYESQKFLKDKHGGGQGRYPDFIVHLPENRDVIVDSKMVLNAYEEYCNADNDADMQGALKRHVTAVREHMKDLSSKNYEELAGINPLEQVIMCVPSEPAYVTAVQEDPTLHEDAMKSGILIVGPNTLVLTLKIIAAIWRTEYQNRNAQEIATRGQLLYEKFVGFVDDLEKVSKAIDSANSACRDAKSKLVEGGGNLVGQAQKLIELGVKSKKSLPTDMVDHAQAQLE